MTKKTLLIATLFLAAAGTACQPDDPAERAAEDIKEAGEELKSAAEDIGNEVEDACEDVKAEAGAADTDC